MKVIGIDIGTTSICGVVLDAENGNVLQSKTVNSQAFIPTANEWENVQDVEKIIGIATDIVDSLLAECGEDVLAIGLTGQMHGIVYVDALGHAVSPLYTWQDGRGNLPYKETTYAEYLGSCSGYGNVTDFYNRENGLVPKEAVTYCTIHDYVGMVLCQNAQPILHASDAASFGLYDVERGAFDYDYHAQVTDAFLIIGTYNDVPVSIAIGDNQASVFATLASENDVLINIGTGSQVSVVADRPITAENIECRPYVDGKYLLVGAALCGGRAYSMLKEFYQQLLETAGCKTVDVYDTLSTMLVQKTKTTLKVDTRFAGTRWDATVRGSIMNISTDNLTPSDLAVGVLHGMADELYGMYCTMGEKRSGIVGSGNGVRQNPALVRVIEQVFDGKLRVPLYTEEAACGAALFALVACGCYPTVAEVQTLIKYTEDDTR